MLSTSSRQAFARAAAAKDDEEAEEEGADSVPWRDQKEPGVRAKGLLGDTWKARASDARKQLRG